MAGSGASEIERESEFHTAMSRFRRAAEMGERRFLYADAFFQIREFEERDEYKWFLLDLAMPSDAFAHPERAADGDE